MLIMNSTCFTPVRRHATAEVGGVRDVRPFQCTILGLSYQVDARSGAPFNSHPNKYHQNFRNPVARTLSRCY